MTGAALDPKPASPARRWRVWTVAAAVVLLAVTAVAVMLLRGTDSHEVRFEVESRNDKVAQIMWGTSDGVEVLRRDQPGGASVATPWTRTVTVDRTTGRLVLEVLLQDPADDTVSCRVVVDGTVRAYSTTPVGASCSVELSEDSRA